MTALIFLVVLGLVFAVVWINLAKNANPRAKLGPDGTNVREPETFVVHHEGKGQGLDIANTALKERTEELNRDLPGDTHKIKTPVPGREMVRMDAPPSDVSKFGDEKVAPGAEPKEKVLTEGPIGSRPGTPEEPGSPYAKGRRVTDNYREHELAAELLPEMGRRGRMDRDMAASPSTNGQEPGYGLGKTAPGETDGEGGPADDRGFLMAHQGVAGVTGSENRGKVIRFRTRSEDDPNLADEVDFQPDASWAGEFAEDVDWSALHEHGPLPQAAPGEDAVVAMVRNPRSLYVYWEKDGFGDENLKDMLGEAWRQTEPVLRVFDVTSGAHPGQTGGDSFTIKVGESDDHWFVNEGIEPGHRYVVSYERRTQDGRYFLISHSSPVQVPHADAADPNLLYQLYGRQPGSWSGSPWR